jgi:transcriptional regulator with XRE-family HTH domain
MRDMSQSAMARAVGVTQPTVNAWVRQGSMPGDDKREAVADALRCDAEWLFRGKGTPPSELGITLPPVNLEGASRSEAEMELYHLLRSRGVPQDDVKQLIAEIAKLIPGWPR